MEFSPTVEGRIVVVTSGKGGVGKTTVTANLGMALANAGFKVCMIDTDTGLRNLDIVLGLEQRVIFDLCDVVHGVCKLHQALIHDRRNANLYFLPASQRHDKSAVTPDDMRLVGARLRQDFDFVVIDCPAGIEDGFKAAIAAADQALVVVNAEVTSVRDADRVLGLLQEAGIREVRLVVNRARFAMMARNDQIDVRDLEELLGVPTAAVFPDDPSVITSTNRGIPLVLDRDAALRPMFQRLAAVVAGMEHELQEDGANGGIWKRITGIFARGTKPLGQPRRATGPLVSSPAGQARAGTLAGAR